MANEATLKLKLGEAIDFTVADGTGIEKGCICKLSDPRTAAASSASGDIFAGVAAREKIANDGRTRLALYRSGIFDMKDSGSGITAGDLVMIAGANTIKTWTSGTDNEKLIIGVALETAAAGEVIEVLIGGKI